MDLYHIWFDKKHGVNDVEMAQAVDAYLGHLKSRALILGWRLTRRKLGLGPRTLGEFHVAIEVRDLAQLETAFGQVARRSGEIEVKHHGINSLAENMTFALYRDFPDAVRERGEERF